MDPLPDIALWGGFRRPQCPLPLSGLNAPGGVVNLLKLRL